MIKFDLFICFSLFISVYIVTLYTFFEFHAFCCIFVIICIQWLFITVGSELFDDLMSSDSK